MGGERKNSCSILEIIDILKNKYDIKLKYSIDLFQLNLFITNF